MTTGPMSVTSSGAANVAQSVGISQDKINQEIAKRNAGGTTGGPTSTVTKTKYTIGGATSDINTIWRQYTGKSASKKQINAVTAAINAALAANPDKTFNSGGDNSVTNTVVGADSAQIIKEQALKDPETSKFQAATTYYDALLSTLQGPGGSGY
jgi:hypothetical protein